MKNRMDPGWREGRWERNEGDLVRYEGAGQYEYNAVWLYDV